MKKEVYTRTDGTEGFNWRLEAGDEIVPVFSSPRMTNNNGFENYSLGILLENETQYIKLTKTQYQQCLGMGDIGQKTLVAYEYENTYGKQVGIKLKA